MSEEVRETILALRQSHSRWGPRKLRAVLQRQQPDQRWPALSSMGAWLHREGLAHPRQKRRRTPPGTAPLQHAQATNQDSTPAAHYVASQRLYPERLPEIEYPQGMRLRRISERGQLAWKRHQEIFVRKALAHETVGLWKIEES
jgi:hypothetical protein